MECEKRKVGAKGVEKEEREGRLNTKLERKEPACAVSVIMPRT